MAVVLAMAAILCGWVSIEAIRAYRQRSVVRAIWGLGGYVWRVHERPEGNRLVRRWYRMVVGDDFMNRVVAVRLATTETGDEDLIQVGRLTHLELLDLRDTRITDRGLGHLRRLSRLKVLIVTGTGVSDQGLLELSNMPQLIVLCLGETNMTDEGLQHLRALTGLRWLDLGGTRITDASLGHLMECPHLEVLILDRCAISPEGVTALENALPLTRVCDGSTRYPSIQRFVSRLSGG